MAGFTARLVAPAEPVVNQPSGWGGLIPSTHDRDNPLAVAWAGSGDADVIINLLPVRTAPNPGIADGNGVTCIVPDNGSFTIPAEALGHVPGGGGFGPNVALTVVRSDTATTLSGDTEVLSTATASHTVLGAVE